MSNETKSRPAGRAPLPIFEQSTSPLFRSNDGTLEVLPMQYGYGPPTFEVRAAGLPVLCTLQRVIADAYVAGYDEGAAEEHCAPGRRRCDAPDAEFCGCDLERGGTGAITARGESDALVGVRAAISRIIELNPHNYEALASYQHAVRREKALVAAAYPRPS